MGTKTRMSYDEQICRIFHRFDAGRDGEPVDLDECFDYAEKHSLWELPKLSKRAIFKREMSRALSRERICDDSDVPIRRNHVFRVRRPDGQGYFHFWGEILKMKPEHWKKSMRQRLLNIAKRAIQHDRDARYWNEKNTYGGQLEFDYNLNAHVEYAKNPTEWPDERPDEE